MHTTIIAFRGSVTDQILDDARRHGLLNADDNLVVVSFPGDVLAQPGDVMVNAATDLDRVGTDNHFVIIGNSGQSAQAIPVIVDYATSAAVEDSWDGEDCGPTVCPACTWKWSVVDVQRESTVFLAGDK